MVTQSNAANIFIKGMIATKQDLEEVRADLKKDIENVRKEIQKTGYKLTIRMGSLAVVMIGVLAAIMKF